MNTKQTITVIGVARSEVYSLCQNLAGRHYRLILCGDEMQNSEAIAVKIKTKFSSAEVEAQDSIIDASWEADIIILNVATDRVRQIAQTIREVANQKLVVIISGDDTHHGQQHLSPGIMVDGALHKLLPNSKLVQLYFREKDREVTKLPGGNELSVFIRGNHKADLCVVAGLLEEAGCDVIIGNELAMLETHGM